ncbi:hypothetical protein A6X21_14865 [Planctopirus hydrillae]|uniref:Uncharacterized protein n=1 Tax=Planctopirus hydrillae TaxID=1841610 RepID=A0A1C3E4N7_9PLAN|nr:hypothetical protein A6X21_14865 [Planctopirus hydrillae]
MLCIRFVFGAMFADYLWLTKAKGMTDRSLSRPCLPRLLHPEQYRAAVWLPGLQGGQKSLYRVLFVQSFDGKSDACS